MSVTVFKDTEEILNLVASAQKGSSRSENELVKIYAPYVEYMVRKYSKKTDIKCDEDLRSYINLGLLDGIRKFNPNKNTRFIYFAHIWMKKNIFLGEASYRFIKLPSNQKIFYDKFLKNQKKEDGFVESEADHKRFITIKNSSTGVFTDYIGNAVDEAYEFPDKLLMNKNEEEFNKLETYDSFAVLKNNIKQVLSEFTDKEIYIINNIFGLGGFRAISVEQIASNLGVTKVNITFTKTRVIRMLRHQSLSNRLLDGL